MYKRSPGRRGERPFTDTYVPGHDFDPPWRVPEAHSPQHWNDAHFPRKGPSDEWGRFKEEFMPHADRRPQSSEEYKPRRSPSEYSTRQRSPPAELPLGYAERRRLSPKTFEERQTHSPRRLPRESLPSLLTIDHHHRRPVPNWGRNEHGVGHPERQESGTGRGQRGPRGSSPRGRSFNRSQEKRHDRMEHGYHSEEHNERNSERSPFSDRLQPKKSEFRDHRPDKRSRDLGHYEDHGGPQRPYSRSPGPTPVIVEHDHGISQRGGVNRSGAGERRDHVRHAEPSQDRHRKEERHDAREEPRMEPPPKRRRSQSPPNVRKRHNEPLGDHKRPYHLQEQPKRATVQDVDLRPDRVEHGGYSGPKWEQQRQDVKQPRGKAAPAITPQRPPYRHRNPNVNRDASITPRVDSSEQETLKIRVDMNRSMGQDSSSFSYNSDRQLSLDLVNVGRQRLDFLPMLEHSGTFRETPVHTGTFAQEIITLVHQVKETYFKGEHVTLNDRFSSVMTADPEVNEEAAMDKRIKVSVPEIMPLFSKMENTQLQRRLPACDPSDLRHDLERRRQERLEGVKVTISGANFSQAVPESVESEPVFKVHERRGDEDGRHWAEEGQGERREWGGQMTDVRQRMSEPNRRDFNRRFNRPGTQPGPNRHYNNANGANW